MAWSGDAFRRTGTLVIYKNERMSLYKNRRLYFGIIPIQRFLRRSPQWSGKDE